MRFRDKFDEPVCRQCRNSGKESRVFAGIRSINYLHKKYVMDLRCSNEHDWTVEEDYPPKPEPEISEQEQALNRLFTTPQNTNNKSDDS